MKYCMEGFQPEALFRRFEELSAIPRSSGNEGKAADYLVAFAREHQLEYYRDALHNIVIKKAGSAGCEALPALLLQGHTEVGCEKNAAVSHDFAAEGIRLVREGNFLRGDGTTLGADNGVAIAMMLALLEDGSLAAPPLECAFTVQEETGLTGAKELNPDWITARTMINLDSEDEGVATVSCAGGMRVHLHRRARMDELWKPAARPGLRVAIRGLLGGHSGMDIASERGNANKLMGRLLACLAEAEVDFRLASLHGGSKDNAIPRECDCVLSFADEEHCGRALELIRQEAADIFGELGAAEPSFCVEASPAAAGCVMDAETTGALTELLFLAPDGVLRRNVKAGGFTVTSVNLGVARADCEEIHLVFAPRSSVASLQQQTRRHLALLGARLGFSVEIGSEYPGWSYQENSPIRTIFSDCYKELYDSELKCEAIHAGLECGLFVEKLPGLDAVAIGPNVRDVHTPGETLDLPSCERTYRLLVSVLKRLTVAK